MFLGGCWRAGAASTRLGEIVTVALIFYEEINFNQRPAVRFGVRFNAQAVPAGAKICIRFEADGTHSGVFPFKPEGFLQFIGDSKADYGALCIFQAQVRSQVLGKIWT